MLTIGQRMYVYYNTTPFDAINKSQQICGVLLCINKYIPCNMNIYVYKQKNHQASPFLYMKYK